MKRQRSSLDGGAGCSAAAPSPDMRPENSEFAYLSSGDVETLDCGVCCLPLKPPIFQCEVGHVVCSPCSELKRTGKCHVCRADTSSSGGYRRCHAMERVVESVHVPCPNAAYGCAARPAYHGREEHFLACWHAPCHCPDGVACGFVGSVASLLDHLASAHGWPCQRAKFFTAFSAHLRVGFNFIAVPAAAADDDDGREYLFLLNVTRHPFCRAVSVIWIRAAAENEIIRFHLSYHSRRLRGRFDHTRRHTAVLTMECSDLSDGLPDSSHCQQLIVPASCVHGDDGDGIKVNAFISII